MLMDRLMTLIRLTGIRNIMNSFTFCRRYPNTGIFNVFCSTLSSEDVAGNLLPNKISETIALLRVVTPVIWQPKPSKVLLNLFSESKGTQLNVLWMLLINNNNIVSGTIIN